MSAGIGDLVGGFGKVYDEAFRNGRDRERIEIQVQHMELAELFHELREYLDQRADTVDDESGEDGPSVSPNAAMTLLTKVDKALESLEVK